MCPVIRPHQDSDGLASLAVFLSAIRTTAALDYSPEQICAWASEDIGVADWTLKRQSRASAVATIDEDVVGFTDVDEEGYIDMLFVHPAQGRRGVATALLEWAVSKARKLGAPHLFTHASITARPFFEHHGFIVVEQRQPKIRGVTLPNYSMRRPFERGTSAQPRGTFFKTRRWSSLPLHPQTASDSPAESDLEVGR